jgi:CRISPR-associated endoribonuclease Cas6
VLLSVVVAVRPTAPARLPPALGRAAHAVFLDWVRAVAPAEATALHAAEPLKPFTAGLLEEGVRTDAAGTPWLPDRHYHLRFTSFSPELSALLRERVLPARPERVRVEQGEGVVEAVYTAATEHPWAGETSYDALVREHLLAVRPAPRRLALAFDAPTTFRVAGRHVPLPLPELVYGSLLERWNAWAPVRLEESVRARAVRALAVAYHRLQSRHVRFADSQQVGFVGQCAYAVVENDSDLLRQLGVLTAFAFWSGVGHRTTMGLGRLRPLPARLAQGRQLPSAHAS